MLIPLEIEHPYERTPYATYALIATCVGLHLLQHALAEESLAPFLLQPRGFSPHQPVTSALLHAGWGHLLGNMVFLLPYGKYVEERLGPWRYLAVFFATSLGGDIAYLASGAVLPSLGASGGIAGLFGLVLVTAPWAQVRVVFLLWFKASEPMHFAAFWLLGWWLLVEVLTMPEAASWGVAGTAHLGGFATGAALGAWCRRPARQGSGWWIDPAPPGGGAAARKRLSKARSGSPGRTTTPATSGSNPDVAVVLTSLPASVSRVTIVKLLMVHAGLEPDEAMRRVQQILAGTPVDVPVATRESASLLQASLQELGAETLLRLPPVQGGRTPGHARPQA